MSDIRKVRVCVGSERREGMARAITARSRDDGFTVVELVIAAAVLFFAMTALIGLLGASTRMTASAKSRSALTNTISSEIETIRALPYDKVAYDTSGGGVPHTKTVVTEDGVTVTLNFAITNRDSQNHTKEITVRGVATRPGAPTVRFTTFAVFFDRVSGKTGGGSGDGPLIVFDTGTPPEGSVLKGKKVAGTGTDISIAARATSQDGTSNITKFEYTVDGVWFTDAGVPSRTTLWLKETNSVYPGDISDYTVPDPSPDERWTFVWNTLQVDTQGRAEVPDGIRMVTIVAYDDEGRSSAPARRRFLLDNHAPVTAPPATLSHGKNADFTQTATVGWTPILDGTYPTDRYGYELRRKTVTTQTVKDWPEYVENTKTTTVLPLAYYVARVWGVSVLGSAGPVGNSPALLTSPILRGDHDVTRTRTSNNSDTWTYTSRFKVDPPNVPYSSVSAVVLERTGPGSASPANIDITDAARSAWSANETYNHTDVSNISIGRTATQAPPEYRLKVTLTPAGASSASTAYSQYCKGQMTSLVRPGTNGQSASVTGLSYAQRW